MNIYRYIDYRKIIHIYAEKASLSFKNLAESTGIHSSYFSRVMVEKANFSQEQLYTIGKILINDQAALEYFLLLGLYSSSGTESHRQHLKNKIDLVRHQKLKLSETLDKVETVETKREDYFNYFLNPLTIKVHIFLTLNKYKHQPKLLVKKLNLTESQLHEQLKLLQQLRFIEYENGRVTVLKDSLNLEESDPLSAINHSHWRLEAIKNISKRRPKLSDYHFTAAFSANEEVKQMVKMKFKDFLLEVQKLVAKIDPPDEVYYISFDLFEEE